MSTSLPRTVDAQQLDQLLRERRDIHLIDLLPEEYYKACHIRGARNACVFKMSFLDDMEEAGARKDSPIVVYASSDASLATQVAREKLFAAGYSDVCEFRGGLAQWQRESLPCEAGGKSPPVEDQPLPDGRYVADTDASTVVWTGRNMGTTHHGTLSLHEAEATLAGGSLKGACVVMDMTSIHCTDITDRSTAEILEAHLRSDDFFDTDNYPQATFTITLVQGIPEAPPGSQNIDIKGDLTIKGITHTVDFKGYCGRKKEQLVVRASTQIDRTKWKVLYGSGRFFERLGMHLVDDKVGIEFRLFLNRR